jgi:hypothetical protein
MMKLLCEHCGAGKLPGVWQRSKGSAIEPPEFERVIYGRAKQPTAEQRFIAVNGERHPLPLTHYDCDECGGKILPGAICVAWSAWVVDRWGEDREVAPWEHDFLDEVL